MKGTGRDVANAFVDGYNMKGYGSIESKDGILFSYATPIAYVDHEAKGIWVNLDSYSVTTAKQQSYLKDAMERMGMKPTEKYLFARHLKGYYTRIESGRLTPDTEFRLWK